MFVGLIARQRLSLVMPSIKSLSLAQKWSLFDDYVTTFLEFSPEMKPLAFMRTVMLIAKSWRAHKSKLVNRFLDKGLQPFEKHPHIEPEDWAEFVLLKQYEEAQKESEKGKELRKRHVHEHNMGPIGYSGKQAQWEAEDRE